MLLENLKSDKEKELEGVWVKYHDTDIEFKIARIGNAENMKKCKKILRGQKSKLKTADLFASKPLIAPAVARHVLLDWKNLQTKNSKGDVVDVKFSYETALKILQTPEYDSIYDFIMTEANDIENFRVEQIEEAEGN